MARDDRLLPSVIDAIGSTPLVELHRVRRELGLRGRFAGTAGTFTGVMRALRAENPRVTGYLVEPATAAVLAGRPVTDASHRIQGGGYAMAHLPLLDPGLVTGHVAVTDDEALAAARLLARSEGIFGGVSAGANLAGALTVLETREPEATVAFIVCDSGLKYLSTDLYPPVEAASGSP